MLRVDLPSTRNPGSQHPISSSHTGNRAMRASRNRRQKCPDRAPGPSRAACLHCAYAERRSTRASTLSTAPTSTSTSQDIEVSLPAAAESPSHLVRSASFEAQQTGRSHLIAAYTSVELTLGVISNPPAPQEAHPDCVGPWTATPSRPSPPQLGPVVDHCHLPTSDRLCLWPRGGLVFARQDDTSASQASRPSVLQPWAS